MFYPRAKNKFTDDASMQSPNDISSRMLDQSSHGVCGGDWAVVVGAKIDPDHHHLDGPKTNTPSVSVVYCVIVFTPCHQ